MERLFDIHGLDERFELFSWPHVAALLAVAGLVLLLYQYRQELRRPDLNSHVRRWLIVVLLASEGAYQLWHVVIGEWRADYSMPLHLCSISLFLSAAMLWTKSDRLFEFTYLAGLAGALQALLTPDLGHYSFPHFRTFEFFIAHGAVVAACFFMVFVERSRPTLASIGRSLLFLNVTAAVVYGFNVWSGGNYMFLMRKSSSASLLDLLGPWPWYILALEGIAALLFLLLYLPFGLHGWRNRKATFSRP